MVTRTAEVLPQAFRLPEDFYAAAGHGFDSTTMPLKRAVMFSPLATAPLDAGLGGRGADWTFVAGAPTRLRGSNLEWPLDPSGLPLTHLLQLDLYGLSVDQGDSVVADCGLPTTGLLQFFHDGLTYGDQASDAGSWHVRIVPKDAASAHRDLWHLWEAAPRPVDMDEDAYGPPIALDHQIAPSIPSLVGLNTLPPALIEPYYEVYNWLREYPYDRNLDRRPEHSNPLEAWDEGFVPLPAPSRVLGFSGVPVNDDYDRLVRRYLPLDPGDEHMLLADINPMQFDDLNDLWLHGGRHVEFWMRRSDFEARRFDQSWALIRTDHSG